MLTSKLNLLKFRRYVYRQRTTLISVSPPSNAGIGKITMSAPPVNSLSKDLFDQLTQSIEILESDKKCHSLVLTSSCKIFSSGMDLNVFNNPSYESLVSFWDAFQRCQRKLYNSRLFTVAGINGHAIAGGCILSLCCDQRVINHDARIGLNESTFGLVPPTFASFLLSDTIGYKLAYDALTIGTMFTAGNVLINFYELIKRINLF